MSYKTKNYGQDGFTLVELSIVLVIIGLLLGGIIKGFEILQNARLSSVITDINKLDVAAQNFRFNYNSLPGDLPDAETVLPNCPTTGLCGNFRNNFIDGNGIVTIVGNDAGTVNNQLGYLGRWFEHETSHFFIHLAAANLIDVIDPAVTSTTAAPRFDVNFPASSYRGGYRMGYTPGTAASINGAVTSNFTPGHYIIYLGAPDQSVSNASANILTPNEAYILDRKTDDGDPFAGSVRPGSSGTNCTINNTDYNVDDVGTQCSLFVKFLGK